MVVLAFPLLPLYSTITVEVGMSAVLEGLARFEGVLGM
jgi:hypothetical protein